MIVNSSPREAVFRCDASPSIGSGHIYRCLTLADALIERGWKCIFLAAPGSEEIVTALGQPQYNLARGPVELNADVLVVDHYDMNAGFEHECRPWAKKILVIDDLANRAHDCDILVDMTYGREEEDYSELVPKGCEILTGAEYAFLRPQFHIARKEALAKRKRGVGERPRVLVSMGSTNIKNATGVILYGLREYKDALDIDVVLGAKAPGVEEVKKLAADSPRHNVRILENVSDMAALMTRADVAIGTGGTTSWERCCLGLPSLIIEVAENQSLIAQNLHALGAADNLGLIETLEPQVISGSLEALLGNAESLINMSKRAAPICDGMGAERIAEKLTHGAAKLVA